MRDYYSGVLNIDFAESEELAQQKIVGIVGRDIDVAAVAEMIMHKLGKKLDWV